MRDVKAVGVKFWHVLLPKQSSALLRECKFISFSGTGNIVSLVICTCIFQNLGDKIKKKKYLYWFSQLMAVIFCSMIPSLLHSLLRIFPSCVEHLM